MTKRKFDYDSDAFYDEIYALALQGLTDAEIADGLKERFGESLIPETFCAMKNGHYAIWSDEENERRGTRLRDVLERGRRKINAIVRGAYLKAALGGKRLKTTSTVTRRERYEDGTYGEPNEVQTTETEAEMPPSIQALANWLHLHDKEWRKASEEGVAAERLPEAARGVDIEKWILKETSGDDKDA